VSIIGKGIFIMRMLYRLIFLIGCLFFSPIYFAYAKTLTNNHIPTKKNGKFIPDPFETKTTSDDNKDPPRRAKPVPLDSVFPSSEYLGPLIGVPNTDPIYPLTKTLWNNFPILKKNDIRIYGWINPSYNRSSSTNSNAPMAYDVVPNNVKLNEFVLRIERNLDTVQTDHIDWGFRLTNLYGMDYRYTIVQGILSNQLLEHNYLYGYDPVEAYGQVYFPSIAQGMVVTLGRYFSPPDIESQLAPDNYLFTHSLMSSFDQGTQTGINTAIKFNDQWTVVLGVYTGGDVAPWASGKHIPTGEALVRWVSHDNNDSIFGGIDSFNDAYFKGNHDNLQQFNVVWAHRFTKSIHTATEMYYIYEFDSVIGGTCNFGPEKYGAGGGCGEPIPGKSQSLGAVNLTEFKISDKDFLSLRTDYLDDVKGAATGFATQYMSYTIGLSHQFWDLFRIRPEVRYEFAFKTMPYANGTRAHQTTFGIDSILRF